jgi:hypothetical protein
VGVVAAARAARFEVEMRRRSWGRGGRRGVGCGAKGAAAVAGVGGAGADAAAAAAAEGPKGMLAGSASPVGETGVGGGRYRPPPLGGRSAKLIVGVVGSSFVPGAGPRSLAVVGWVVQRHRRGVLLLDGRRRGTGRSEQAVSEGLGRCDLGGPPTGNSDSDSTRALGRSGHVGVDRRKLTHHLLIVVRPLGVYGLRMLPEVVEAGELLAAVAGKGTFARVLPDVPEGRTGSAIGKPGRTYIARRSGCHPLPCQVFTSGKDHSAIAVATALERLGSRWAYTTRSARGGRCRGHVRGKLVHVHVDGSGGSGGEACVCVGFEGMVPDLDRNWTADKKEGPVALAQEAARLPKLPSPYSGLPHSRFRLVRCSRNSCVCTAHLTAMMRTGLLVASSMPSPTFVSRSFRSQMGTCPPSRADRSSIRWSHGDPPELI